MSQGNTPLKQVHMANVSTIVITMSLITKNGQLYDEDGMTATIMMNAFDQKAHTSSPYFGDKR